MTQATEIFGNSVVVKWHLIDRRAAKAAAYQWTFESAAVTAFEALLGLGFTF